MGWTAVLQWGQFVRCLEAFGIVTAGIGTAAGVWQTEAREAAKRPAVHRTAPTTKSYMAHNVSAAEIENLGVRLC